MKWFGVKVLFCVQIQGQPEELKLDAHYHPDDYYEESLLLIQAEDVHEAAEKAADECRAKDRTYINRYGQFVTYRFYDWLEADEIRDFPLRSGTVALSSTYRMAAGTDVEGLIDQRFSPCGPEELFPLHHLNADL